MKCFCTAAVVFLGVLVASATAVADEDCEYWGELKVAGAVDDDLAFRTSSSARFDEDGRHHYYTHTEIGFDWKVSRHVILGAYYRHVNTGGEDEWGVEYRPHLNVTFHGKLGWLGLSDRQRMEYRLREGDESFRYRNRLTVSSPGLTGLGVRPYVAVEPFYDFGANEINKNRAYVGAGFDVWGPFRADVCYMYENRKAGGDWCGAHVIGTTLKYGF